MHLLPVQVSSKLDKEDVAKIEKEVNDTISWLDANQLVRVAWRTVRPALRSQRKSVKAQGAA